jgi:hypothetical protein
LSPLEFQKADPHAYQLAYDHPRIGFEVSAQDTFGGIVE